MAGYDDVPDISCMRPEDDMNEVYDMTGAKLGKCLVIVNYTFPANPESNLQFGPKICERITETFYRLNFDVETLENGTAEQIQGKMRNMQKYAKGSFVCCIMTHGNSEGVLTSDCKLLPVEWLMKCMDSKHCPKLAGKPKVFFVESCRTGKPSAKHHEIPDHDFLIAYATTPLQPAGCHKKGGYFFRNLLAQLNAHGDSYQVVEILQGVNAELKQKLPAAKLCQIAVQENTLTKLLYFSATTGRRSPVSSISSISSIEDF